MNEAETIALLAKLRSEHRLLDEGIEALVGSVASDQLRLARLKKRKLRLRDEISRVEAALIPDIVA